MKSITIKKQMILINAIIVLICFFIGFGIIYPTNTKINRLQEEISENEQLLEQKYSKIKKMKKSLNELEKVDQAVKKYGLASIKQGEELDMITKFEKLAADNHIEQHLTAKFSDSYYVFSFDNKGRFADQMKYLNDLEKAEYFLIIEKQQWTKENDGMVSLKFDGKLYVY